MANGIIRALARALSRAAQAAERTRILQLADSASAQSLQLRGFTDLSRRSLNNAAVRGIQKILIDREVLELTDQLGLEFSKIEESLAAAGNSILALDVRNIRTSTIGAMERVNSTIGAQSANVDLSLRLNPGGQSGALGLISEIESIADNAAQSFGGLATAAAAGNAPEVTRLSIALSASLSEADRLAVARGPLLDVLGMASRVAEAAPQLAALGPFPFVAPVISPAQQRVVTLEAIREVRAQLGQQMRTAIESVRRPAVEQ